MAFCKSGQCFDSAGLASFVPVISSRHSVAEPGGFGVRKIICRGFRFPANLHVIYIRKKEGKFVPVFSVLRHIASPPRNNCLIETLDLAIRLMMVFKVLYRFQDNIRA